MKFKDGGDFVRSLYENGDCELFDRNRRLSIETALLARRFDEALAELKASRDKWRDRAKEKSDV